MTGMCVTMKIQHNIHVDIFTMNFHPKWDRFNRCTVFSVSLYINRIYVIKLQRNSTHVDSLNRSDIDALNRSDIYALNSSDILNDLPYLHSPLCMKCIVSRVSVSVTHPMNHPAHVLHVIRSLDCSSI
jgi:hypothetical protein